LIGSELLWTLLGLTSGGQFYPERRKGENVADYRETLILGKEEWPWHAAILEKPQDLYVCGATLVDESWILTAAHCVDDYLPFVTGIQEILKVRLGEYDVSTTAEPLPHEEFDISDIQIHPNFNNATLVNDIALLRLVRPARRKQNIDGVYTMVSAFKPWLEQTIIRNRRKRSQQ